MDMSSYPSPNFVLREARLRPEAGARCPWAPAGTWLPASTLATTALSHAAKNGAPEPNTRALTDDAFEFRGGPPEATLRARARTRWSDHSYPSSSLHRQRG
jgi:hypothetical protein